MVSTVIMLQKVLVTVVFSPILASRYQKLPQVGQKQNVDSLKKKWRESSTNWVSILNEILKKSTLYSQSNTEKIHDRLQTLFGPSHLWDAGQSISISIPWVCNSLHNKVAFSLDYKPPFFFFKTWCKQNPLESEQGWPRVHCTKADPQRGRER